MKKIIFSIVALFYASASFAGQSSGCGLGAQVFAGETGLFHNVLAVTTNGTSGNQTFGITSGTSGCSANDVVSADKEAEVFIATNYERIMEDASQGQGEFIAGLSEMVGCEKSSFSKSLQENYNEIFATTDAQQILAVTKQVIATDASLASQCNN